MGLAEVLRAGLERLAERCPSAPEASEACAAVFVPVPASARTSGGRRWTVKRDAAEDALMAAAGALLLDPDHAVAAGGCLRPVALHALSHALDALLASAASAANDRPARAGGASATPSKATKRKGKSGAGARVDDAADAGATRHERACAALGTLLELLPHAKPIAARYLRRTPPPFARLVADEPGGGGGTRSDAADHHPSARARALLVVRACVRLLRVFARDGVGGASAAAAAPRAPADHPDADPDSATPLAPAPDARSLSHWDLTPLVRFLRHPDPEIRWTVSMALERTLGLPAEAAARLRARQATTPEQRHAFAEAWEEIDTAVALERAAAFLDPGPGRSEDEEDDDEDEDDDESLPWWDLPAAPGYVRVGGVEVRRREGVDATPSSSTSASRGFRPMIMTRSARRNLEATALALCQGRPLLLEGPAGSGKSATLEEVARATGNDDFVTLHLDAQTDSKSLLGSYVVGAAPGEFKWQPGALTQAVAKGMWVVIEDVDLAPFEVLAALVPLLEERRLYVPGRGESVPAAEGFQLFGTVTTGGGRSGGGAAAGARADPLAGLWARVAVEPPSGDEPAAVLVGMHPNLEPLAPAMLRTLNVVQRMCGQGGASAAPGGAEADADADADASSSDDEMDVDDGNTGKSVALVQGVGAGGESVGGAAHVRAGRPFTLRDLLRWARRLEKLRKSELSLLRKGKSGPDSLPPKVRVAAYEEAADVLAGMLPAGPGRRRVLEAMAACWGLGADAAEHQDLVHKPALQAGTAAVAVGRAVLPAEESAAAAVAMGAAGGGGGWAKTGHAMRILERVAAAVQMTEPALLVGETGTGKTALVQQLARVTGAPLTVVNLSNQSESADFLGGFRPAGARHLCLPLLPRFKAAFDATFPSGANAEFMHRVTRYAEKRKWTHLLHAFRAGVEKVAKLAAAAAEEETNPSADPTETAEAEKPTTKAKVGAKSKRGGRGKKKGEPEAEDPEPEAKKPPAKKRRRAPLPDALVAEWRAFERDLSVAERAVGQGGGGPVFAFVEGALVTALREGRWILLDEINLAPAETLERLGGVLESAHGSVVLSERGDGVAIARHPRFRLFGAMNPATDVGKRDLPAALKHRFTEIYAGECEGREDLALLVSGGLSSVPGAPVDAVVDFYLAARQEATATLLDSADQKPQYSLRTLSRAMEYVRAAAPIYGVQRALYDGFAMSFHTLLKAESGVVLERLMVKHLLRGTPLKVRRESVSRIFFFSPPPRGGFSFFARNARRATPPARGALYVGSSRS